MYDAQVVMTRPCAWGSNTINMMGVMSIWLPFLLFAGDRPSSIPTEDTSGISIAWEPSNTVATTDSQVGRLHWSDSKGRTI